MCHLVNKFTRSRLRRLYNEIKKLLMKASFQHSFPFNCAHITSRHEISGADALRGHTRSHLEHDG